ncbi:MAG: hypothetical protein GWO07_15680 [Candidatus Dadabacteria bacterium]|nr:hypothetical protein [Candidatus Dadabacteria bacterium]NIS10152.1 hypothetical protein [Candidatus Dadabacteria bacterium]NIV42503.1 hypothetical protein [Candidatus Dadabacteria bacterium]NIX16546.1 hypothetical protein [Candidatus Dadabacteria bacterium]NIY23066.1 hypothetical protein [Candidatus Dadabacteria bacterium]
MRIEKSEEIIDKWKDSILSGDLEDYVLKIDDDVKEDIALIALFLDYMTVKASGNAMDYYEGYKQAASDILGLTGIYLVQDDQNKLINIKYQAPDDDIQEQLKKHIWGDE